MAGINLFPMFMVGLLGSVHCGAMCGGIVSALSLAPARASTPAFPVPVRTVTLQSSLPNVFAYNAGRIGSYMIAGALAGGAAGSARSLAGLPALQAGGFWLANLMLIALGLYLMDAWRGLAWLEQGGRALWRHVQPLMRRVGPPDTPAKMLATGFLWGWLPCGMVYSALVTAMLTGSSAAGASVMLAFGLGTLPMLVALGAAGAQVRAFLARRAVRVASGVVVLGFGVLGLVRAAGGLPQSWLHTLCITPGVGA
ncbi:sulfite exporter TauE/SafE family protein [Massilia agilis]|uniref:Sulfite exporter TauE/SafE family protein n=1 Tax=Massilia agilis TaxID=1811226 RepID=A0ABT2D5X4_9BURK|nr:sulfite exporter TauE/SafE family protein [Massilia agilis]MCS0806713.1 sulfite exporter TauE/SafE family protein [Massilia agilis]